MLHLVKFREKEIIKKKGESAQQLSCFASRSRSKFLCYLAGFVIFVKVYVRAAAASYVSACCICVAGLGVHTTHGKTTCVTVASVFQLLTPPVNRAHPAKYVKKNYIQTLVRGEDSDDATGPTLTD